MAQTISTLKSVQNILNSRPTFSASQNGQHILVSVKGNGTIMEVKNADGSPVPAADGSGEVLRKRIINVVANSDIALKNERNLASLKAGRVAELAGDAVAAAKHYNDFLNKCQLSFNVLSTQKAFDSIADGDQIKGKLSVVTTDKGSLLTIDGKSISIAKPIVGEVVKMDLATLIDEPVAAQDVLEPVIP